MALTQAVSHDLTEADLQYLREQMNLRPGGLDPLKMADQPYSFAAWGKLAMLLSQLSPVDRLKTFTVIGVGDPT